MAENLNLYKAGIVNGCCNQCKGEGKVPWSDLKEGMWLMSEEIAFRIWKADKNGFPIKTYRQMLHIARVVRKTGADCHYCGGTGAA